MKDPSVNQGPNERKTVRSFCEIFPAEELLDASDHPRDLFSQVAGRLRGK